MAFKGIVGVSEVHLNPYVVYSNIERGNPGDEIWYVDLENGCAVYLGVKGDFMRGEVKKLNKSLVKKIAKRLEIVDVWQNEIKGAEKKDILELMNEWNKERGYPQFYFSSDYIVYKILEFRRKNSPIKC
jgi:hypothetical protein